MAALINHHPLVKSMCLNPPVHHQYPYSPMALLGLSRGYHGMIWDVCIYIYMANQPDTLQKMMDS